MAYTLISPNRGQLREKVFADRSRIGGVPLDGNAKARIMAYAKGYNARHKQKGQHRGPLTRAIMEVLEVLLWSFHNSKTGACFPSYETIAARAQCNRDTVYEAIKALEFANVITWVHRLTRIRERLPDLFGAWSYRWRVIRTSNAYVFRDPLPCAPPRAVSSKSENPTRTLNQDSHVDRESQKTDFADVPTDLLKALHRLGTTLHERAMEKAV